MRVCVCLILKLKEEKKPGATKYVYDLLSAVSNALPLRMLYAHHFYSIEFNCTNINYLIPSRFFSFFSSFGSTERTLKEEEEEDEKSKETKRTYRNCCTHYKKDHT